MEELNIDEDKRKVLDLKFINGLKNYQIAMETNRSLENVNNIIGRAYDKVFRLLKKGIFKWYIEQKEKMTNLSMDIN